LTEVKDILEIAKKKRHPKFRPFAIRVDPETSVIVPDDDGSLFTVLEPNTDSKLLSANDFENMEKTFY
jgi:hypothetical protein